jgi:hypothetical protein
MQHKVNSEGEDEVMLAKLRLPEAPASKPGAKTKPASSSRRRRGPFVLMELEQFAAYAQALRCPQAIVPFYIHYRMWADNNSAVPLPNETLARLGVSREMKRRTLLRLEKAKLIRIESKARKSPLVTLLVRP